MEIGNGTTAVMDAAALRGRPTPAVWAEYKRACSAALRNELLVRNLPLARYQAERIAKRLPDEVQLDDLLSAGIFGLLDAIDAFDAGRGVKFETYCAPRIRGAILDELRAMDWVPRLVRSRTQLVDRAARALEAALGRRPTDEELRRRLKVSRREFRKIAADARPAALASLSRKWFDTDSGREVREGDMLADRRGTSPSDGRAAREFRDVLCRGLTRAERLIVTLYYYEDMNMKSIGRTLDLSESRVSQMHASVINRLRAQHTEAELLGLLGLDCRRRAG